MNVATDEAPGGTLDPSAIDSNAAARGAVYGLLARAFDHPDDALFGAIESGAFPERLTALLGRTGLSVDPDDPTTDDDYDMICARYNDMFVLGYSEYEDKTDGTISTTEPPVPLYESAYRRNASWTDVNLDLARAYDYYGLEPDSGNREHHDHLRLQLEFAGYLARREAAFDGDAAARARLDLLDRHLRVVVEGVAERMQDEPATGVYGPLVSTLDAFTEADRRDLFRRLEEE